MPQISALLIFPLFHVSGLAALSSAMGSGGFIVTMDRWDPDRAADLIERHGITLMSGPPMVVSDLMAIGGAEDKLRQRQILTRFIGLAGGSEARVVVISTASSLGDEATQLYLELFRQLGVTDVRGLRPLVREDADDHRVAATLEDATGIFMTGGNQLRLSSVIGGTALGRALAERHRQGAIIAGTKVSDRTKAAANAMMTVSAMGVNILPSTPWKVSSGT